MVRGTGKFKQKRGGGRSFSKNLTLDENGTAVSTDKWAARGKKNADDDDDDDDDDEDDDEESEEEDEDEDDTGQAGKSTAGQPELTRAERRDLKKKQNQAKNQQIDEEEEDPDLVNPNRVSGKTMSIADLGAPKELSRREREAKEKKEAQERYWKLHLQGKTDQAKADLARLAQIKKDREEAQAKRKAEADAKAAELEAKKKAAESGRRRG